jgi:hypothetical protein
MILTTKERQQCQQRYEILRAREPYKARIAKQAWTQVEDLFISFGPHVSDIPWLDADAMQRDIFPRVSPMTLLMDVMEVPATNGLHYGRANVERGVMGLLQECDMKALHRSVAIGWISLAADHLIEQAKAA